MKFVFVFAFVSSVAFAAPQVAAKAKAKAAPQATSQIKTIELSVTEKGFEPSPIKVKKGEPLRLLVT